MSNNIFHGKSNVSDEQAQSLKIEQETANSYYINDTVGAIGSAYNFSMTGEFDSAEISFEFDSDLLLDPDFDPVIYWFDEEEQELVPLTTTVTGSVASAEVEHFSYYLLINQNVHLDSYTWEDDYEVTINYDNIEMVVVIDDSDTTIAAQGNIVRENVAATIDANMPIGSKTGVVRISGNDPACLSNGINYYMYNSGHLSTTLSIFQSQNIQGVRSNLNRAVDVALDHFGNGVTTAKFIVLLSDGLASTSVDANVLQKAKNKGVKIISFAIGNYSQGIANLKLLAYRTGGTYYGIGDYLHFASYYADLINIDIDSDSDGLPDYYESNIPIYNGNCIVTSPNIQDTDGDTLKDGEEIIIYKEYIPIKNKVLVRAMMLSDPRTRDTDGDGISDTIDARPLKNDILRIGLANDYVSIYGHPGVPRFLEDIYYNQYTPSYGGCQNWFNYTNFQITHPNREIRDYINIAKNGCTFIAASDFLLYMLKYHPEIDSAHNYSNKLGNINYLDFNTYMEELLFWEKFLHVSEYPLNSTQLQNGLNFLFMNYDIDLLCSSSITEF